MLKDIPYDWYNNSGGGGTIFFRFNPDPLIMFDVVYEGYYRVEENVDTWDKQFDDGELEAPDFKYRKADEKEEEPSGESTEDTPLQATDSNG